MTKKTITEKTIKTEKIIREIVLDNHQKLQILDKSRKISADAYLVAMEVRIDILIEKNLFSNRELESINFDEVSQKLGYYVRFEYKEKRNFIMAENKDRVLQELVDKFCENMIGYLSKDSFPYKFVLKKYRDLNKKLLF